MLTCALSRACPPVHEGSCAPGQYTAALTRALAGAPAGLLVDHGYHPAAAPPARGTENQAGPLLPAVTHVASATARAEAAVSAPARASCSGCKLRTQATPRQPLYVRKGAERKPLGSRVLTSSPRRRLHGAEGRARWHKTHLALALPWPSATSCTFLPGWLQGHRRPSRHPEPALVSPKPPGSHQPAASHCPGPPPQAKNTCPVVYTWLTWAYLLLSSPPHCSPDAWASASLPGQNLPESLLPRGPPWTWTWRSWGYSHRDTPGGSARPGPAPALGRHSGSHTLSAQPVTTEALSQDEAGPGHHTGAVSTACRPAALQGCPCHAARPVLSGAPFHTPRMKGCEELGLQRPGTQRRRGESTEQLGRTQVWPWLCH